MMKTCYIDTNTLLYYKIASSQYHQGARDTICQLIGANITLCISPLVIDEYIHGILRVLKKDGNKQAFSITKRSMNEILNIFHLKIITPPTENQAQMRVFDYMKQYSLKPRDAYHLLIMKHNDISHFATFDTDFEKVFADGLVQQFK